MMPNYSKPKHVAKYYCLLSLFAILFPMRLLAQRQKVIVNSTFDSHKIPAGLKVQKCCNYSQTFEKDTTRFNYGLALRFELDYNMPLVADSKRCELSGTPVAQEEGWYGYSMYVPASFVSDTLPDLVTQYHNIEPTGKHFDSTPPLTMRIQRDSFFVQLQWSSDAGMTHNGSVLINLGPVTKNTWIDWVWHIKWSYNGAGITQVWRNGVKVIDRVGPNCYNDGSFPYFKCGIYKSPWAHGFVTAGITHREMYFDELRIASAQGNYNSVVPAIDTPFITSVNPQSTTAGKTITISGVNFLGSSAVSIGGVPATSFTVANDSTITAVVPPNEITSTILIINHGIAHASNGFIYIPPFSNNYLKSLTVGGATLVPSFSPANTVYTVKIPNTVTFVNITPVDSDINAKNKIAGNSVASGKTSPNIQIAVGIDTVHVIVTATDNSTKTYSIAVIRESSNANLLRISFNTGTLSPGFTVANTNYSLVVPEGTASVSVTSDVDNKYATIAVNGIQFKSGVASSPIPLSSSLDTVNIKVTALDGTLKTYSVIVHRLSSNDNLASLIIDHGVISPAFGPGKTQYYVTLPDSQAILRVIPTAQDAGAIIKVNGIATPSGALSGPLALVTGKNNINVLVQSSSGPKKTYKLTATRSAPLNGLSFNSLSAIDTLSKTGGTTYTVKIFPNPARNTFSLQILNGDSHVPATIRIRNLQGRLIYQVSGNAQSIYTFGQNFAPGMYLAQITNGKFIKQVKLLKVLQ